MDGDVNFPAWSHDSQFIYGLVFNGKGRWIFRVPLNGKKPQFILDLKDVHLTGYNGFSLSLDPTDTPSYSARRAAPKSTPSSWKRDNRALVGTLAHR